MRASVLNAHPIPEGLPKSIRTRLVVADFVELA